jgi:hypothetical protein
MELEDSVMVAAANAKMEATREPSGTIMEPSEHSQLLTEGHLSRIRPEGKWRSTALSHISSSSISRSSRGGTSFSATAKEAGVLHLHECCVLFREANEKVAVDVDDSDSGTVPAL